MVSDPVVTPITGAEQAALDRLEAAVRYIQEDVVDMETGYIIQLNDLRMLFALARGAVRSTEGAAATPRAAVSISLDEDSEPDR